MHVLRIYRLRGPAQGCILRMHNARRTDMARIDYSRIPELQAAARRHRAEAIGNLFAAAVAWVFSRRHLFHVPRTRFAR
jgi:hypothetical protein